MTVRPVPFHRLPGSSALFEAYLTGDALLAGHFAHPDWASDAALRAAAFPRDRAALVAALGAQQPRWGNDPSVAAALDRLAEPDAVAVVTGQQVGLFGGPLYTLLKAVTAVRLARHVAAVTGRPAVPVFWMASEDHDVDEVAHARVGEAVLRLPPVGIAPGNVNAGAAGRLVLDDRMGEVVAAAVAALPETEQRAGLAAALRAAYAPGTTLVDAFGRLLRHLMGGQGLVLLDPDDAALKAQGAGLFAWAARSGGAVEAVRAAGEALTAAGFHAQIPDPTAPGLFLMDAAGRLVLDADADGYRVRATGERFSRAALEAVATSTPERLSAGVTLRPAWQDTLLPTAAYVAGPGEIAYWAQLRGVYDAAGVPMPVVYPRLSATLVDARTRRALDRLGVSPEEVEGPADALFARHAAYDPAQAAAVGHAEQAVRNALAALDAHLTALPAATREAARVRMLREVERLHEKARRAERRRQEDLRAAATRAVTMLRPDGLLQERAQSALPFAAHYGPLLAAHLAETLPLDPGRHYVVHLSGLEDLTGGASVSTRTG
jgi:bacillithiol synthase